MDSTPFPGKSQTQNLKSKPSRKIAEDSKSNPKNGPPVRKNRVFGASQNPNIPLKPAAQKPKPKPSSRLPEKPPKSALANETLGENQTRSKKKSVCFQEKEADSNGNVLEPRTPVKSPSVEDKPRLSGTPYRSAKECSKCRFDKLETSAYWMGQIKLAEYGGKHFCSAAFFRLALECNAEPLRNIKVELKKYLTRHECLKGEEDWKRLMISYGLAKQESSASNEKTKAAVLVATAVALGEEHLEQDEEKENAEENGSSI